MNRDEESHIIAVKNFENFDFEELRRYVVEMNFSAQQLANIVYYAVRSTRLKTVKFLVKEGHVDVNVVATPSFDSWPLIGIAIRYSTLEMVQYLVGEGANLRVAFGQHNDSLFILAALAKNPFEMLRYLREQFTEEEYKQQITQKFHMKGVRELDTLLLCSQQIGLSFNNGICAICLDSTIYKLCKLNCGHHFHIECLHSAATSFLQNSEGQAFQCVLCNKSSCQLCNRKSNHPIVKTTCGHEFHLDCLFSVARQLVCPTCNEVL